MSVEALVDRIDSVKELLLAAVAAERERTDDLRAAERSRADDLRDADNKRRDDVRAVDVNSVVVANEKAGEQATVLANQVDKSAETLRQLVSATATATANQLSQQLLQFTDRLASLERIQNESRGSGAGISQFVGVALAVGALVVAAYAAIHR